MADWLRLDVKLEKLLKLPATRRALRAVGLALRERGAISGSEVERLVEEAERG